MYHTVDLEQGLTWTKTTFVYTELPYHCR